MKSKSYSTETAAKLIGINRVTLQRWLGHKVIRPSISIPLNGRTLWRWTAEDVRRAKRLVGTFKPGPKLRSKKK